MSLRVVIRRCDLDSSYIPRQKIQPAVSRALSALSALGHFQSGSFIGHGRRDRGPSDTLCNRHELHRRVRRPS